MEHHILLANSQYHMEKVLGPEYLLLHSVTPQYTFIYMDGDSIILICAL